MDREFAGEIAFRSIRLIGVREPQVGNRRHIAATAETTGYVRAFRRAFDWQQICRLR
jgi:hypothetical protein